jgi:hypothetical protein
MDEPEVAESFAFMIEHTRAALENLGRAAAVRLPAPAAE